MAVLVGLVGEPQSNQRGIETREALPAFRLSAAGLNRTSVGLKPGTEGERVLRRGCLNRTSVGLKLVHPGFKLIYKLSLNRTSVGLKHTSRGGGAMGARPASIEPAWD